MSKLNREWHLANKMPKNPTDEERLKWHQEHAKHCPCRPLTEKLKEEMRQHGMEIPVLENRESG